MCRFTLDLHKGGIRIFYMLLLVLTMLLVLVGVYFDDCVWKGIRSIS
jgi:hypothetical protein